jgi:hypothetical protein
LNEGITRCAPVGIAARLRSVVRAVLAAIILVIASTGLTGPSMAQATAVAAVRVRVRIEAWRYAMRQRGKPYIWGGSGPDGFDCSGLVYSAYRADGVALPRTTYGMLGSWHLVRIRKSQARRGDLAFFGTGHVELYDRRNWTYGAEHTGTRIGFHRMNSFWHPTMYFRVRR